MFESQILGTDQPARTASQPVGSFCLSGAQPDGSFGNCFDDPTGRYRLLCASSLRLPCFVDGLRASHQKISLMAELDAIEDDIDTTQDTLCTFGPNLHLNCSKTDQVSAPSTDRNTRLGLQHGS